VMRDGRLRQPDWVSQVADACLAALVASHDRDQLEPGRVSERLEDVRQILGLPGCQGFPHEWRTARICPEPQLLGPGLDGDGSGAHPSSMQHALTTVYSCGRLHASTVIDA
jgi:hypothetical protein